MSGRLWAVIILRGWICWGSWVESEVGGRWLPNAGRVRPVLSEIIPADGTYGRKETSFDKFV